jgi:hypothetical protein
MPEDMEYPNIATKNRDEANTVLADIVTLQADVITAQNDATTAIGNAGAVDTRVGNAVIAMNANGVGYVSACLESVETGNGVITVFNFTVPGGSFVANSETVFSLGNQQKRTSQYAVTGPMQVTFTGGNEPASEHVYMDCLIPVVWGF